MFFRGDRADFADVDLAGDHFVPEPGHGPLRYGVLPSIPAATELVAAMRQSGDGQVPMERSDRL
jgi:hypothetical protein